ncbi:MAG: hypothetical protein ACXAEU_11615 [Candidatus Hodarchaeales archaeon]|jgi:hypothetical protein
MDETLPDKPEKFVSLAIKKVKRFEAPDLAYWIAIGKLTGKLPQLALSCYNNILYIFDAEGRKISGLDWSTNLTSLTIGDIKGDGNCLVAGDLDGVVRVIDNTGSLFWAARLGGTVTCISAGDIDGDGAEEVLVGMEGNKIVLLDSNSDVLWQKKLPTKLVRAVIGDYDIDGHLDVIVADNIGNIYIYDSSGNEKQTIHLAQKISGFEIVHLGEISCFAIYERTNLSISFYSHHGRLLDFYYLEGDARIKFMASGHLIGSENDEIVLSRVNNDIEIMSIDVLTFDEEGNPIEVKSAKDATSTIKQIIISTTKRFPEIKLTELDEIVSVTLRKKADYNLHSFILKMIKDGELSGFIRENTLYRT